MFSAITVHNARICIMYVQQEQAIKTRKEHNAPYCGAINGQRRLGQENNKFVFPWHALWWPHAADQGGSWQEGGAGRERPREGAAQRIPGRYPCTWNIFSERKKNSFNDKLQVLGIPVSETFFLYAKK